ncbi:hypothetical protein ACIQXV_29590 [Neobacillus sp. NPDC097160]|uniref:hypothetical protein n=1 Tax=Neobacillus sp. NPDC097160 TaxID=3364298 RepID=UPI0038252653
MVKYKEFELITVAYDEYEFHPSFASKMTSQLTDSGSKLLEEPIANCVCALFINEDKVIFDSNGNGSLKGEVIDWSSFGRDVTVKWSSSVKKNVLPSNNVEDLEITFSWCEDFPVSSLKKGSKKKTKVVDTTSYPFAVEYSGYLETDVSFEISVIKNNSDDNSQILKNTFNKAIVNWNDLKKTNGRFINYLGEFKKTRGKYKVHIDLGNGGQQAIDYILNTLAVECVDFIEKIIIKQS